MTETMLAMLREEYLSTQEEKKNKRREIQERHREAIAQEVAIMEETMDIRLGEMLVRALGSGLKRMDIWKPVFGTNDNKRWSRLVELGGGEMRVKRTGSEIVADAQTAKVNARVDLLTQCGVVREYTSFYNDAERPAFEFADGVHVLYMNGELWPVGDKGGPNWHAHRKDNAAQYREIKNLCKEEQE